MREGKSDTYKIEKTNGELGKRKNEDVESEEI